MRNSRKRPEPGARVHQEAEQDPAVGIEDLAFVELRGVGLVDGLHDLLGHAGEALSSAEVFVDHARGRVRARDRDAIAGVLDDAEVLRAVMVERERDLGAVRQVRRDVVGRKFDLAVLHVLGVDEQDVVEDPELLQQGGADETVEVAAGDQAACPCGRHDQVGRHDSWIGRSCTRLEPRERGDSAGRRFQMELAGLEPATSWVRSRRSPKLSYSPGVPPIIGSATPVS